MRRAGELVARYGGEEFVVVVSETDADAAAQLAESIRAAIAAAAMPHAGTPSGVVTASVGLAVRVPQRDEQPDSLIARADEALYRAKQAGRNRVEVAG